MLSQRTAAHDGFTIGFGRAAHRTLTPGLLARAAARMRPWALDRALIAGGDPATSAVLAARAALLTSPRARAAIADGLERLVEAAEGRQRRWWAVGDSEPLRTNAAELRALALALRSHEPLYAPGIAILSQLLSDGDGPAYHGGPAGLARRLAEARAEL